jgi:S-sulfo-L-cysteine synthase (O-acetyl-L-serine-dependent)
VLDLIGNTLLLRIERVAAHLPNVEISAKAEWCNPGGSVKDRAALAMIKSGLAKGDLVPGKTILDATSGNTGIAYAMIGAALGYPVKLFAAQRIAGTQAHPASLRRGVGDDSRRRRHRWRDSPRS